MVARLFRMELHFRRAFQLREHFHRQSNIHLQRSSSFFVDADFSFTIAVTGGWGYITARTPTQQPYQFCLLRFEAPRNENPVWFSKFNHWGDKIGTFVKLSNNFGSLFAAVLPAKHR